MISENLHAIERLILLAVPGLRQSVSLAISINSYLYYLTSIELYFYQHQKPWHYLSLSEKPLILTMTFCPDSSL